MMQNVDGCADVLLHEGMAATACLAVELSSVICKVCLEWGIQHWSCMSAWLSCSVLVGKRATKDPHFALFLVHLAPKQCHQCFFMPCGTMSVHHVLLRWK